VVATLRSSRVGRYGSRIALCGTAVLGVALIGRLAAVWPVFFAVLTAIVALGMLVAGYVVNGRGHGSQWRTAWLLLGASLALLTVSTTVAAAGGFDGNIGVAVRLVEVLSACLAGAGIVRLLANRVAGGAGDIMLEGAIIAAACTYVAWAWSTAQHVDHVATSLLPVFAWVLVVWLTGRLLYMTPEQVTGYRLLGGSFVGILLTDAIFVGTASTGGTIHRGQLIGFTLCAYLLWGAAALHPSTRENFAPAEITQTRFGIAKLTAHLAVAIVAPVALLILPVTRQSPGMTALVAASALLPLLLVGYLVRQIRGRARAEYRAQHDELTGLPNRRLFEDRAESAFRESRRDETKTAVLFLDLDRFKAINDGLGHSVGNQLLQSVAKRLSAVVREIDTVARFGGDEFTVLVGDVQSTDDVAELARGILDLFARPFNVGGRELHTSTSVGVALFPDDGEDLDTLLKNADIAMYRAKARGRDAFEFYTPGLAIRAQTKLSLESGLRHALQNGGLKLHFQPQLDMKSGHIFALEALARWPHPKIGMIPPDVFVPVAEESNLVIALGEFVIDEACAQARRWLDDGIKPRPIAVNISARHFATEGFADVVRDKLARYDIPPGTLEIEITESIFMRDIDQASIELAELRAMGVRCAIDDFGTGFSGLRYLHDMSIDALKIDQSFVSSLRMEDDISPIIDAIIGLADRLDLDVVAEGVETEEQVAFLVAQGCTKMQGYLFSRPMPAHAIERTLRSDDNEEIDWLAFSGMTIDLATGVVETIPPNEDTGLLRTICSASDEPLDIDASRLPGLLAALASDGSDGDGSATFLKMPLRLAAGTCVGLVPLVGGLAAAGALPGPVQSVVAATGRSMGIELPATGVRHEPPQAVHVVSASPPITTASNPPTGDGGSASGSGPGASPGAPATLVRVSPTTSGGKPPAKGKAAASSRNAGHRQSGSVGNAHGRGNGVGNGNGSGSGQASRWTNAPAPNSSPTTWPWSSPSYNHGSSSQHPSWPWDPHSTTPAHKTPKHSSKRNAHRR
jgi:diguanylate cyclase (GGDEF)-like protein